jgi:hypothetical protein
MRIVLACFFSSWIAFSAAAEAKPPSSFYERAGELAAWIGENSDYGAMKKHPIYIFLTQKELDYILFEATPAGYTGNESSQAVALYFDGIVFLSEEFRLGLHDDILLHELVHHLQAEQGRELACVRAGEKDAYALQTKFVRETGIGNLPDPMWAHLASRCESF